jgi:hypothetical protein
MTEHNLFHVMDDDRRVVIFTMDHDGDRTVYCPGGRADDAVWPRYPSAKPYLDIWFDQHAGQVVSSPHTEFQPGTPEYPRGLASALTYDHLLSFWAYVTRSNILVSSTQIARAAGTRSDAIRSRLRKAGVALNGRGRSFGINDVKQVFGSKVADRVVLFSGQIADFLGVWRSSVPNIVERLGIGVPGRRQVGVLWGTLRRVQRTGPRSFKVRDA